MKLTKRKLIWIAILFGIFLSVTISASLYTIQYFSNRNIQKILSNETELKIQEKKRGEIRQVSFFQNHQKIAVQTWNANNELIKQEGTIPNGFVGEYSKSGQLKSETYYQDNGKKITTKTFDTENRLISERIQNLKTNESLMCDYHPNGRLKSEKSYQGLQTIFHKEYDPRGILILKLEQTSGFQKILSPISYCPIGYKTITKETNEILIQKEYSRLGQLLQITRIKNIPREESATFQTIPTFTTSNIEEGIVKEYYPNGTLKSEKNYIKGVLEGIAKEYYDTGILKAEINYSNNQPVKIIKRYSESGKLKR